MDDLYSRIVRDRGKVENLLAKVPGFRGYMELNARRQADRLIREHVAAQLQQHVTRFTTIEKALLDAGGLSYMTKTRSAKTKLQTFIDRVATDAPGYSGFFDAIKIGPQDLEIIYAFDKALLEYVDKLGERVSDLQLAAQSGESVDEAIRDLDALALEANEAYRLREDVLKGLE
jgi:hypothetical protein